MTSAAITVPLWTLALIVCALGLLASVNSLRFARLVARDARQLWAAPPAPTEYESLPDSGLPAPVQRYLRLAGVGDGRPPVRAARLSHAGTMTMKPGAGSVPVRGQQYFSADPPGFVWWGRIRLGPGLWVDARDKVVAGSAGMKVMVESTKTLQDVSGPELDQGALLRLLGEMTWLPSTLRDSRYVRWEPIDGRSARAFLTVNGKQVSAVFHFGDDGLPWRFTAQRYRDAGPGRPATLTPFVGTLHDWREVNALRVPFLLEGSWLIDGQPYTFARFEVQKVEFDRPEPF